MDTELQQGLGLLTEVDRSDAEKLLTAAVEVAPRSSSWEEFRSALLEADVDGRVAEEFLTRAGRELPDPWAAFRGVADHRPDELLSELDGLRAGDDAGAAASEPDYERFAAFLSENESSWQETWPESRAWMEYRAAELGFATETVAFLRYVDGSSLPDALAAFGAPAAASGGAASGEPDYARFTAFLDRNDSSWQETWPESRAWMEYTAGQEGFVVETTSFLEYVDATTLADALVAYGATPTAPSAAAGASNGEPPSPEQAAADAMALGRRAVDALREQVPDLMVTDEQLIAILDRELRAAAGA